MVGPPELQLCEGVLSRSLESGVVAVELLEERAKRRGGGRGADGGAGAPW